MNALKFQSLIMAIVALLFLACNGPMGKSITGTYVNHASSEFSIADDTLIVVFKEDQNYLIHRKTGFVLIDEQGKHGKLQLESEQWNAVYDEDLETMTENSKGRTISFDLNKGTLKLENSVYQRIN